MSNRTPTWPCFTAADAERAYAEWGCNCGPAALAAILRRPLEDARRWLVGFDAKRYTNPSMMLDALDASGARWRRVGGPWPLYGLVRVQWEGPWTQPGVPMRARYRYTHWIGAATVKGEVGVFDVNCMANGSGWTKREHWEEDIVPAITALYKRASGAWHPTHVLEVTP